MVYRSVSVSEATDSVLALSGFLSSHGPEIPLHVIGRSVWRVGVSSQIVFDWRVLCGTVGLGLLSGLAGLGGGHLTGLWPLRERALPVAFLSLPVQALV